MLEEKKINQALDKVWAALLNGLKLPMFEASKIKSLVEVELKKLN